VAILATKLDAVRQRCTLRHEEAHQVRAICLGCGDGLAGQRPKKRLVASSRSHHALRATRTGHDADADLGLAELRVLGGNDHVAREGSSQPRRA
jgi:hypothetical protein